MNKLLEKLKSENILSKEELISLLENDEINSELFKSADEIRKTSVGDEVYLRGLIEFSNICKQHCQYCGLRCENSAIKRYRLNEEEIINSAKLAKELGLKTIVLQSGEDSFFTVEKIQNIIKEIKKLDVTITLSIGEKSFEEYKAYKESGADRYLLRIETTDNELYKTMHPKMNLENRKRCLKDLKTLSYEVGSGILVGLPQQTISSLAEDLLFLKGIDIDMAGIGPFIPSPNTPLANAKSENNFLLSLKVMAIMRLMLPEINIPATTAMETLKPNGRIMALQSGANVIMPNVTEMEFQNKYEIYPNKTSNNQTIKEILNDINSKLISIGRTISTAEGTSKHFLNRY